MKMRIDRKEDGVWLWVETQNCHFAILCHDPRAVLTKRMAEAIIGAGWFELTPTAAPDKLPDPKVFEFYNRLGNGLLDNPDSSPAHIIDCKTGEVVN